MTGYLAFLDPPKDTAKKAIAVLRQQGITIKVLTGDNDLVSRKVCTEVGINAEKIVLGSDVEKMSDEQLAEAVETTDVFARLSPAHKKRVVQALQRNKHVVGFMGDGINDAPALRAADVGISVDNAVDIAKESADVILLEKDLMVLEEGVIEGRKVFVNILKYIRMGASSNFGNMFSVLGASAWLPFLPMLPIQLLTNNLLYDFSQVPIPTDNVGRVANRQAAPVGDGRDRAVHHVHRPDQLDLRLHHLCRHVVFLQMQQPGPGAGGNGPAFRRRHRSGQDLRRLAVSNRLVRRIDHDPDAHHPRHPHQPDSVHPVARKLAADHDDDSSSWASARVCPIRRWRRSCVSCRCRGSSGRFWPHADLLRRPDAS